jgi:succinyl-diaminopimelate desuccinylase
MVEIDGEALIWGRGTVDMKAGVAVQLKLAAELTEPVVDITWMWYDNEEVEAARNGLKLLADRRPDLFQADFAILGEPSNGEVEGGCNGTLRAVVRTTGVRAHSARAWIGENAIHRAAPILARLAEYRPREIAVDGGVPRGAERGAHQRRHRRQRHPRSLRGRGQLPLRPEQVRGRCGGARAQRVRRLRGGDHGRRRGRAPGLDAPIAQEFLAAVGATPQPKYGWTDVARFSALGIPAVNYGPAIRISRTTTRSGCRSRRSRPPSGACVPGSAVSELAAAAVPPRCGDRAALGSPSYSRPAAGILAIYLGARLITTACCCGDRALRRPSRFGRRRRSPRS